jgi:hypothetical protein
MRTSPIRLMRLLFPVDRDGMMENQRLDPDPFSPRARGRFADGNSDSPRYLANRKGAGDARPRGCAIANATTIAAPAG